MAFPPSAYIDLGCVGTVVAAKWAKWLMEEEKRSVPDDHSKLAA